MVDQNRTSTEPAYGKVLKAVPVTPSVETERPEGLAFDVEKGTGLPGVPVGDQTPGNPGAGHTEQVVRETGEGVGLVSPATPAGTRKSPSTTRPANTDFYYWELDVIILGIILLIIGFLAHIAIVWTIGTIVVVVGAILALLGMMGHAVGGRRHYF